MADNNVVPRLTTSPYLVVIIIVVLVISFRTFNTYPSSDAVKSNKVKESKESHQDEDRLQAMDEAINDMARIIEQHKLDKETKKIESGMLAKDAKEYTDTLSYEDDIKPISAIEKKIDKIENDWGIDRKTLGDYVKGAGGQVMADDTRKKMIKRLDAVMVKM
jgi:hypothetical protein